MTRYEGLESRAAYRKAYRQEWWLRNRDRVLAHRKAQRAAGYGQKGKSWVPYPKRGPEHWDFEAHVLAH